MTDPPHTGIAVVTGVGRRRSIGSAIALGLAEDGWDLVLAHWSAYDDRLGMDRSPDDPERIADGCRAAGASVSLVSADLADPDAAAALIGAAPGPVTGLVLAHTESVDSSILTTTVESWDRHFAVNARAAWLLIRAFADQLPLVAAPGEVGGRIVALTSDHTAHNLPYGASKGALDRIVIAAAAELAERGVRANVVNPGPVDNGWMSDDVRSWAAGVTAAGRVGRPEDPASLVRFLFSPGGDWINGQLLKTDGGFQIG